MKKYRFALIFLLMVTIFGVGMLHSPNIATADGGCGTLGLGCLLADVFFIPLGLTSLLLGLSGILLNAVLNFSVINLAANINAITGIPIAWGFLRDLSNMVFIFVLIYIAIKTILGLGNNKMKQTLVAVVIAALLINFSLFFTKVMVDASNLIALTFYEKAVPNAGAGNLLTKGLSNSFMQPLGLTSFYDVSQGGDLFRQLQSLGKVLSISLFGSIFFVVLAAVFLVISVMFIIRYVNIIFLLILSPVAFLGSVLPGFGERIRGWWAKSLSSNLVFAPVYMILTFAVLTIINKPGFISGLTATGGAGAAATAGSAGAVSTAFSGIVSDPNAADQGSFGLVMNFIVVIVLAVGTFIISQMVAAQGGSIGAKVLGAGTSGAAWGGRKGGGWLGRKVANSERLKNAGVDEEGKAKKGIGAWAARQTLRGGNVAASSSFDVRAGALNKIGTMLGGSDLGIGKAGGKGGYDAVMAKKVEKKEKIAKSYAPSELATDRAKQELAEAKKSGDKEREKIAQAKVDNLIGLTKEREKEMKEEVEKDKQNQLAEAEKSRNEKLEADPIIQKEKELQEEIEREEAEIETTLIPEEKERRQGELELKKKELEKVREVANMAREFIEGEHKKEIEKINKVATEKINNIKEMKARGGIGKRRAESYARTITEPSSINVFGYNIPLPSGSRAGFIGPVSYANRVAAAKIRAGKSTEDRVVEFVKKLAKEGEEASDEKKDDKEKGDKGGNGATTPPPASGASSAKT